MVKSNKILLNFQTFSIIKFFYTEYNKHLRRQQFSFIVYCKFSFVRGCIEVGIEIYYHTILRATVITLL